MKRILLCLLSIILIYKCNGKKVIHRNNTYPQGKPFEKKEFPFFVQLVFDKNIYLGRNIRCGGSLVYRNYVLTSATCLARAGKNIKDVENTLIKKKKLKLYAGTNVAEGKEATIFEPVKIIFHKNYVFPNDTTGGTDVINDIAVIKVKNITARSSYIGLVRLPLDISTRCTKGIVLGQWFPLSGERLKYVHVNVRTGKEINRAYNCNLINKHLYTEDLFSASIGSPFICHESVSTPVQYGLILFWNKMFSDKCSRPFIFGNIEDITMHMPFIYQATGMKKEKRKARIYGVRSKGVFSINRRSFIYLTIQSIIIIYIFTVKK